VSGPPTTRDHDTKPQCTMHTKYTMCNKKCTHPRTMHHAPHRTKHTAQRQSRKHNKVLTLLGDTSTRGGIVGHNLRTRCCIAPMASLARVSGTQRKCVYGSRSKACHQSTRHGTGSPIRHAALAEAVRGRTRSHPPTWSNISSTRVFASSTDSRVAAVIRTGRSPRPPREGV